MSCFLKTTAKKLETNTLLVPNLKVGGPVSQVPTVVVPMCRRTEFLQPMRYFLRYPFYHYNKFTIRCSGDFEGTLF